MGALRFVCGVRAVPPERSEGEDEPGQLDGCQELTEDDDAQGGSHQWGQQPQQGGRSDRKLADACEPECVGHQPANQSEPEVPADG